MSQAFGNKRQFTGGSECSLFILLAKLKVVYISVCAFRGIFERKITIIKSGLAYVSKPVFLIVVSSVGFGARFKEDL
jgi:hypothetical protein